IRLPLSDPDFLKSVNEVMKPKSGGVVATGVGASIAPQTQTTFVVGPSAISPMGDDSSVLAALRTINTAEVAYAATYSNVGYTCTLSDLDGFGSGSPNEHQAMLIHSGLASGKRFGYIFTLSECGTSPANTYRLSAVPNAANQGRKAFCTDQSAVI